MLGFRGPPPGRDGHGTVPTFVQPPLCTHSKQRTFSKSLTQQRDDGNRWIFSGRGRCAERTKQRNAEGCHASVLMFPRAASYQERSGWVARRGGGSLEVGGHTPQPRFWPSSVTESFCVGLFRGVSLMAVGPVFVLPPERHGTAQRRAQKGKFVQWPYSARVWPMVSENLSHSKWIT